MKPLRKRGRPGWWEGVLTDMDCGQTMPVKNKSEAMTAYVAARRAMAKNPTHKFKITVAKQDDGYQIEKVCL